MPKTKAPTKKTTKKPAPAPAPVPASAEPVKAAKAIDVKDAPLAMRLAVLEDVVRRASQETRAFQSKLDTFAASQTELTRRVADVEKRAAQ